jgi:hypothetical protein
VTVERAEENTWKAVNFSVQQTGKSDPESKTPDSQRSLLVSAAVPGAATSAKLRIRAFSPAIKWRPTYTLELGKEARMSMRCLTNADDAVDSAAELECISSSGTPRGGDVDFWSDSTNYPLSVKRLERGAASTLLFDEQVQAEEFISIELGGMAGEPGVKPVKDRSVSMMRLSNRTTKAWPTGQLLILNEGRLVARVTLPHTDAGRATEISLGSAVGVSVSRDEVELDRKVAVVRRETDPPDSIQTAGSATVTNHTGKAMIVRVTKTVAGDATGACDDA